MAKKITAIVSLAIIGVLIIATIIMANINVNHGIVCAKPDLIRLQYASGVTMTANDKDKAEIENLITSNSSDSALKSLFNGKLFSNAKVKTIDEDSKSIPSTNDFYVQYVYNNAQVLKVGNKEYKDAGGNKYYYKELWFSINSSENATDVVNVYIVPNEEVGRRYSKYYELKADMSNLYDFLSSTSYFAK